MIACWLGLLGVGLGIYIPANNTAIMAAIPPGQAAAAGGMVNMARGMGTALGVAVVTLALHAAALLGQPTRACGGHGGAGAVRAASAWAGAGRRRAGAEPPALAAAIPGRCPGDRPGPGQRGARRRHPADGLAEGIARLRRALRRGARVAEPGNTLAVAQFELLSALAEHPGARPGQLARLLNMRPNTVTTIVNALSARGMLSRATADGDRRAIELTVTEAGQQAVHAWQATNAAVLHLALSTLPEPSAARSRPRFRRSTRWPARSTGWPTRRPADQDPDQEPTTPAAPGNEPNPS